MTKRRAPGALVDRVTSVQGRLCPYCGIKMYGKGNSKTNAPTRDHVHPRVLGGGPVVMCCLRCNRDKDSLTLREWADAMRQQNDYRWRTVAKLALDLDAGRLRLVPSAVDPLGVAEGIFA